MQLTKAVNFVFSKHNDEKRVMHPKYVNIEILIDDKPEEVIKKCFHSLLSRYQIGLYTSMRDSNFIFDCVHLLYYKFHKINVKRGGSYIDSLDWTSSKKATINPISKKENKCFQYFVAVVLNHEIKFKKTRKE